MSDKKPTGGTFHHFQDEKTVSEGNYLYGIAYSTKQEKLLPKIFIMKVTPFFFSAAPKLLEAAKPLNMPLGIGQPEQQTRPRMTPKKGLREKKLHRLLADAVRIAYGLGENRIPTESCKPPEVQ